MKTAFYEQEKAFLYAHLNDFFKDKKYTPHHLDHLLRVKNSAIEIGTKLNANLSVLEVSALFHDIARDDEKIDECHAELSAAYTKNFLEKRKWPNCLISQIVYAIKNHRYSKGIVPETLEAKILQDADRLDALGAFGIIRVLQHDPSQLLYNIDNPFPCEKTFSEKTTMTHFYDKILKLIDGFHTKEAFLIAEPRHNFILQFLEELKAEI